MQSWSNQGQHGAADSQDQWQSEYSFPDESSQFDPQSHIWPSSMTGQTDDFPPISHDGHNQGAAVNYHFDSAHEAPGSFVDTQSLRNSHTGLNDFQNGNHGSVSFAQHHSTFANTSHEVLDPSFGTIHTELFGHGTQTSKVDLENGARALNRVGTAHINEQTHMRPQAYPENSFSYNAPDNEAYGYSQAAPYAHTQLLAGLSSHGHPDSPISAAHFSGSPSLHSNFTQGQELSRSQRATTSQTQQGSQHPSTFVVSSETYHTSPDVQSSNCHVEQQSHLPPHQFQGPPSASNFHQLQYLYRPSFPSEERESVQRSSSGAVSGPGKTMTPTDRSQLQQPQSQLEVQDHQELLQQNQQADWRHRQQHNRQQVPPQNKQRPQQRVLSQEPGGACESDYTAIVEPQSSMNSDASQKVVRHDSSQASSGESIVKKKKRTMSDAPEPAATETATADNNFIQPDPVPKRLEELSTLEAPEPLAEEVKLLQEFDQRRLNFSDNYSWAHGLAFLVHDGTVHIPAPKSFDKLAPLVAIPSRSGNSAIPGLNHVLPCDVQGNFASRYAPSIDRTGLDQRRSEAKELLDEYDRLMKTLGKRQPKYTEYPHAFKEQLKADEASKNKAGKKAKKNLEAERPKPVRVLSPFIYAARTTTKLFQIRPLVRPTDLVAAAVWDVIGMVHIEKTVVRTNALIAGRVHQAGEFLIKLRTEASRAKVALDQATKSKANESELSRLKTEAQRRKDALRKALDATVESADASVLENLGGHQKLVLSLVNILISSVKTGDFSGELPKIVLELFTHLTVPKKILESTNFETVRKRLEDKGDEDMKELAHDVSSKMKKMNKSKQADEAPGYRGTSAISRSKAGSKVTEMEPSFPIKRVRDENEDGRYVKKITLEPGSSALSKKLAQPRAQPVSVSRSSLLPKSQTPSSAPPHPAPPGKSQLAAKPLSRLGVATKNDSQNILTESMSSTEAKKPVIRTESKPAAPPNGPTAKTDSVKKDLRPFGQKPGPAIGQGTASSISSLLDSINARKPEAALAAASGDGQRSVTPETAEQKATRLRKEARKRLRVNWKADEDLVQIKVFEQDEENQGRDVNMLRDAADDRSEGMVLKRRADMNVEDEDDETPYQPWEPPCATDASGAADETDSKNQTTQKSFVTHSADEPVAAVSREHHEHIANFKDLGDNPSSQKSQQVNQSTASLDSNTGISAIDDPKGVDLQPQWREKPLIGEEPVQGDSMKRLGTKDNLSQRLDSILDRLNKSEQAARPSTIVTQAAKLPGCEGFDTAAKPTSRDVPIVFGVAAESRLLEWLQWERLRMWQDPKPSLRKTARSSTPNNPDVQTAATVIEIVAKALSEKPFPPTSPPEWLARNEEKIREWWLGYNREATSRQRKDEENRARAAAEVGALRSTTESNANASTLQDWNAWLTSTMPNPPTTQFQQQHQSHAPYMALLNQIQGSAEQRQSIQPASVGETTSMGQLQIPENQLRFILAAFNQPLLQQQKQPHFHPVGSGYSPASQALQQLGIGVSHPIRPQFTQPPVAAADLLGDLERDQSDSQAIVRVEHRESRGSRKKKGTQTSHKAPRGSGGAKSCTYWQQGKCTRGSKCTFRHDGVT